MPRVTRQQKAERKANLEKARLEAMTIQHKLAKQGKGSCNCIICKLEKQARERGIAL